MQTTSLQFTPTSDRPYINELRPGLHRLVNENWDDCLALTDIYNELGHRAANHAIRLRQKVADRLIELEEEQFDWPSTEASPGDGAFCEVDWPKTGLLQYLGYNVQQDGPPQSSRRAILDSVYSEPLPNVISTDHMSEWGAPGVCSRLRKMANTLASFTRNAKKRRDQNQIEAISKWEADLEYLRMQYYVGSICNSRFSWPAT